MLPSATASSGWSTIVGSMPSARCSTVVTAGIRLDPPARKIGGRLDTGGAQRGPHGVDGAGEDRRGRLVELLAAERHLDVEQRYVDERRRRPGQHLLRRRTLSQSWRLARRSAIDSGASSRLQPGVLAQRGAELGDDRRVDVEAAAVVEALGGEHLEPAPVRRITDASNVPAPKS